jgi:hypothetical protein
MFGTLATVGPLGTDGLLELELRGRSDELVARQIAGLAERMEVRAPEAVRRWLAQVGRDLVRHFEGDAGAGPAGGAGSAAAGEG